MKEIMTNLGNEKSPNRVHRTIVPIVPVPPMKSTQTIEHQSLRGRNNRNFIVSLLFFQHFTVVFVAEVLYL